jgi:hypothetical protein
MIGFRLLSDDHPALDMSPLLRAAVLTLDHVRDQGPIGLTQTKAFKRSFVGWAVKHFDWPDWSEDELLRHHKVINEADFPPLELLHFLLVELKLGRHYKGEFRLTKRGLEMSRSRGELFNTLIPFYILRVDHASYGRFDDRPYGKWDVWLNVINIELASPRTERQLYGVFYGDGADWSNAGWRAMGAFSHCVLKPLEWSGLISSENALTDGGPEYTCAKTALWAAALELDTGPLQVVR